MITSLTSALALPRDQYSLSLVTAPAIEPITLSEAKKQCRVDASIFDDDALIGTLIAAARHYAELFTHRALITQTWNLVLDRFPGSGDDRPSNTPRSRDVTIEIPMAPVSSITSITYTDTNGNPQTWNSSNYLTDLPTGPLAQRARITPAYGIVYPLTRYVMNAVTIRFVAGYGATAATVPEPILAAMKLLIAHWYARREPVHIGNLVTPIPLTVESLLWPYKAF